MRTDVDTGLLWMRQRWYDPTLQRFISRDPIGLAGGVNLYSYAENTPTSHFDPNGLATLRSDDSWLEAQIRILRRNPYGGWLEGQLKNDIVVEWGERIEMEGHACAQYKKRRIQLDIRIKKDFELFRKYAPENILYLQMILRSLIVHELQHALHEQSCECGDYWADELNARYTQGLFLLTELQIRVLDVSSLTNVATNQYLGGRDAEYEARAQKGDSSLQEALWKSIQRKYPHYTPEYYRAHPDAR